MTAKDQQIITMSAQIWMMFGAFDLIRERVDLGFFVDGLKADITRTDYDYDERLVMAWLVKELTFEDVDVPDGEIPIVASVIQAA